jgi:4'-phosphopantetheinyl transferase
VARRAGRAERPGAAGARLRGDEGGRLSAVSRPLGEGLTLYEGVLGAAARDSVLRRHLAGLLGTAGEALTFARDAHGKPRIMAPATRLGFSLARRARLFLIATAWDAAVGADLEILGPDLSELDIARNFFRSGETAWLASLDGPARARGFAQLWTTKEAVLKALGTGIAQGLHEPDLSPHLEPGRPLVPSPLILDAAGARHRVTWAWAATADGKICAARALRLPAPEPDATCD